MPTILLETNYGIGFKLNPRTMRKYLDSHGIHYPSDISTDELPKFFCAFHDKIREVNSDRWTYRQIENISNLYARSDPFIIDLFRTGENILISSHNHIIEINIPDIFAHDWYITENDGEETLHVDIHRVAHRLTNDFMNCRLDEKKFKELWEEYLNIKSNFIMSIDGNANVNIGMNTVYHNDIDSNDNEN